MGTFTTNLKLGGQAFGVTGSIDPYVIALTVGQIRVIETLPSARYSESEPVYEEQYMCIQTGVGSGTLWEYGKTIFANEADAQRGVIAQQQRMYKLRAERDAAQAKDAARQRQIDLDNLQRLKAQYESVAA